MNLNRAFVEGAGKRPGLAGITHRIAEFVRSAIWSHVHVVIDRHSGGEVARFMLCTSVHPVDDPEQGRLIEATARWFGTPLIMTDPNETPRLLPSEAERLGKITVGTELGWGTAVHEDGVRRRGRDRLGTGLACRGAAGPAHPGGRCSDRLTALIRSALHRARREALHDVFLQ